jgi:hypothetical protein
MRAAYAGSRADGAQDHIALDLGSIPSNALLEACHSVGAAADL